jgi:hypothetical protein
MDFFSLFYLYIKPDSNVQLVSLAQAGNEISQDTLPNAGKLKHIQRSFYLLMIFI